MCVEENRQVQASETVGSGFDCAISSMCDLEKSFNFSGLQFPHLGKNKDHNIHVLKSRTVLKWDFTNIRMSPGCPRLSSPERKSQLLATPWVTLHTGIATVVSSKRHPFIFFILWLQ